MKKLNGILLLVIVLSISLMGCNSTSKDLTEKEILESVEKYCKTDIISQELVCDTSEVKDERVLAVLSAYEDTTVYPSYMLDSDGNYVSMEDLGGLLKDKYFGSSVNQYDIFTKKGGVTTMRFVADYGTEHNQNEIFAKLVLILEELSNYNYYILNNDVVIKFLWTDSQGYERLIELTTSSENLLSDTLEISPDSFFTGYLEMSYRTLQLELTQENIIALYDNYVANGTYDGYVLIME